MTQPKKAPKPPLQKYKVLKFCLGKEVGAVLDLHPKQAVSLMAGGLLSEVTSKTAASTKSKQEK